MSVQSIPAQAKTDATGTATFTFPPVTQGQWWHVAGIVPTAPTGAVLQLLVNGQPRFKWLGPLPGAAVVVSGGSTVSIKATGLAKTTTYTALLTGSWAFGTPEGVPPQGPSSFTALTKSTTAIKVTTIHVLPIVKTVGVFTARVTLLGTSTVMGVVFSEAGNRGVPPTLCTSALRLATFSRNTY